MDGTIPTYVDLRGTAALGTIGDWNFEGSPPHSLGNIHPYPARFIPEIPRKLISAYRPSPGLAVLDPFCGSGTTLVEAQAAGLPSIGIDVNPIAVLMSRVTTRAVPKGVVKVVSGTVDQAQTDKSISIPKIPNLDHWFKPDIQQALAAIAAAITKAPPSTHDLLRLALSAIIVRVSNQDSDTRYAAVEKTVSGRDVFHQFTRSALKIIEALRGRPTLLPSATVLEANILQVSAEEIEQPVGLVVTSPPYPNAYEYWLYHKYRMWWLGFDPIAVKADEIGARAHFFSGNRHTADSFRQQMKVVFQLLNRILVEGGHACFIVGRSKIHGESVDNAQILSDLARIFSFGEVFRTERIIAATRKSFNLSHANIKSETILVFERRK